MDEKQIEKIVDERVKVILRGVLSQQDIFPDTIKQRHIAEGVRYVRAGVAASRPTSGEKNGAIFFATDTDELYVWNGTVWVSETLT